MEVHQDMDILLVLQIKDIHHPDFNMVIGMVLDPMVCTVLQLHRMAHEIFTCLFTDLLKSDSFIMPVWNNCTCWSDFCEVLYWGGDFY
jgi:hypothetical protein